MVGRERPDDQGRT